MLSKIAPTLIEWFVGTNDPFWYRTIVPGWRQRSEWGVTRRREAGQHWSPEVQETGQDTQTPGSQVPRAMNRGQRALRRKTGQADPHIPSASGGHHNEHKKKEEGKNPKVWSMVVAERTLRKYEGEKPDWIQKKQ